MNKSQVEPYSFRNITKPLFFLFSSLLLSSVIAEIPDFKKEIEIRSAKTVGADQCQSCHTSAHDIWQKTHHFKTFNALPSSEKGNMIAEKMGVEMDRGGSLCMKCHFTATIKSGGKASAGISCESCHSPAKDWLDIHNAKGIDRKKESKEDYDKRMTKAEEMGMLRPGNIYKVAENCYQCHTVPVEELVNKGGHPAGSKFELVSWSQGEVLHNVKGKEKNRPASPERKRVLYVTGRSLDLEYGLRGIAKASKPKSKADQKYIKAMLRRVINAKKHLKAIQEATLGLPEISNLIKEMLSFDNRKYLKWDNEKPLTELAGTIAAKTKMFVAIQNDPSKAKDLSAIDSLIPSPDKYKGTPTN